MYIQTNGSVDRDWWLSGWRLPDP